MMSGANLGGAGVQDPGSRDDFSVPNPNVTAERIGGGRCLYRVTLHLWHNEEASSGNGCSAADMAAAQRRVEDAVRKYWGHVFCPCKPPAKGGCQFGVEVKWHTRGRPTPGSGSGNDGAAGVPPGDSGLSDVVKSGSPAEVYFMCGKVPPHWGSKLGMGRRGSSGFNGYMWIYAGRANSDRLDLLPATAHEIGHNLAGGSFHSGSPHDVMYPHVLPEIGSPDPLDDMRRGGGMLQDIGHGTGCHVAKALVSNGVCRGCCDLSESHAVWNAGQSRGDGVGERLSWANADVQSVEN